MTRLQARLQAPNATDKDCLLVFLKPACVNPLSKRTFLAYLLLGAVSLYAPQASHAQSLNDAVKSQLETNVRLCGRLRNLQSTPPLYLTGRLFTICTEADFGGSSPSVSTGAGAATPTSLPSIVQQRMREGRDKDKRIREKVAAASADANTDRLSFFVFAEAENLDRKLTSFQDGYDSTIKRVTAGVDFALAPRWIIGLALQASQQNLRFDEGRGLDSNSKGIVGFTSFLPTDRSFTQVYAGYTRDSNTRERIGTFVRDVGTVGARTYSGIQHADFGTNQYGVGGLVGYDHPIANVTIGPVAGLVWRRSKTGTYSETGNSGLELTFYDNKLNSLQSNVGLRASAVLHSGSWQFVPQASVYWKHEFKDDQRTLDVSFVGDTRAQRFTYQTNAPDRDWAEISAGVTVIFPNGMQAVGGYRATAGNVIFRSKAFTIGLRVPF